MNVERQKEQSANLRLAEMEGHRCTHKTTNHHGTVIDVSSRFEIYHPDQVAVETSPDRLLNKA